VQRSLVAAARLAPSATSFDSLLEMQHDDHLADLHVGATLVPSLGVSVASSDDAATGAIRLPTDVHGAVVVDVADSGPAQGRLFTTATGGPDVILSVEGTPVPTPAALRRGSEASEWRDNHPAGVQRAFRPASHRASPARLMIVGR